MLRLQGSESAQRRLPRRLKRHDALGKQRPHGGYASIVNAGRVLLDRGQLIVVKPSRTAYEPIAEYRVSDRGTVAHPVFLGDRILIKDDVTLRSFRIERDAKTLGEVGGENR